MTSAHTSEAIYGFLHWTHYRLTRSLDALSLTLCWRGFIILIGGQRLGGHAPFWTVIIALGLAPAAPGAAAERAYEVDPAQTRIEFVVHTIGFGVAIGTMKVRTGRVDLDTDHPANARLTLSLDAASMDTDFRLRDEIIRGSSFLNVAQFPEISFSTTTVHPDTRHHAMVLGELQLVGVRKPVVIDTQLVRVPTADGPVEFVGRTRLWLSDWGITSFLMDDEAQIRFQLIAVLKQ